MVKNQVEAIVEKALFKELKENAQRYSGLCTCPSCLAAIQAASLNYLEPFYITCVAGQVFGEFRSQEIQHYSDIHVAISKGIEDVIMMDPHGLSNKQPL